MTIRDQLVRGLERLGYEHCPQRWTERKYIKFHDPVRMHLYVGKAGALRGGPTIAGSIPLNGLKVKALAAGLPEKTT